MLLGSICVLARAPWPRSAREYGHLAVAGLLVQAGYPHSELQLPATFNATYHIWIQLLQLNVVVFVALGS